jgi:hypothetical protein
MASAWSFANLSTVSEIHRLQINEALTVLQRVEAPRWVDRRVPRRISWAAIVWAVAMTIGLLPIPDRRIVAQTAPSNPARDAVNAQVARALEENLLKELDRLAELTGIPATEAKLLRDLSARVTQHVEQLSERGRQPHEMLQRLSQIQLDLTAAAEKFDTARIDQSLQQLGAALSHAGDLQPVQEAIEKRDLQQAAEQLESLNPSTLSDVEAKTVAEELQSVEQAMRNADQKVWADAIEMLRDGISQQDDQTAQRGGRQLAQQIRQHATMQAIAADLNQQMAGLAEAKGMSRHGGDNTELSNESRQTWGRGNAGDPLQGQSPQLTTQRIRETLQGVQGEGASDREQVESIDRQARSGDETAERAYQQVHGEFERAAEEALRRDPLPLGHRQTIRRYFKAIRPQAPH